MSKPRALTPEQHRELADRHLLYIRYRVLAAQHSVYALAKDFGVQEATVRNYINRPAPRSESREDSTP